jgi:hypothetical protein
MLPRARLWGLLGMTMGPLGLVGPGAGQPGEGAPGANPPRPGPLPDADTWALQADAAKVAGCSVSAIRKWRREGSVAARKVVTRGGLERVEVRLGDVLARSGSRALSLPPGQVVSAPPAAQPGAAVVSLADLQAMFEQVGGADRRTADVMASYRSLESEVSHMRTQLAQVRRSADEKFVAAEARAARLEARCRSLEEDLKLVRSTLTNVAKAIELRPSRTGFSPTPTAVPVPDTAAATPPPPAASAPAPPPTPAPPNFEGWLDARPMPKRQVAAPTSIERLLAELRGLYQGLAARQRDPGARDGSEWVTELARYDTVLVRACARLGVPTSFRPGDRLPAADRVALTRALEATGLDVRGSQATGS